ncbi:hypothetical protein BKA70DRAFT_407626 [Coprinopsis sp. MPI-PUGE-AT-0042]|nr:hypothetical protein BKA70DRAFT_407626 [Coprinopsis sp. MPI-PUGE-AT-0042]
MFAASIFVYSVLNVALLVVQIVLVLYGVSGFISTPKERRKGRLRFIIISSLMLVMCTIDVSFDLWEHFLFLYTGGPDGASYLRVINILDKSENWRWEPIGDAFFFTAIALGDILMLWRCLILWTDRKWAVLFPFLACLGSIGEFTFLFICRACCYIYSASDIAYIVGDIASDVALRNKVQLAGAGLHVAMNIMVTFLIVFRVMRARSRAAKAFPDQKPPRWYSEVTTLVVESAAPLAICGICFIALNGTAVSEKRLQSGRVLQRGRRNIITIVVQCFYDAFCTLSPQMIIVRVTRGKAWDSRVTEATPEVANLSQPIRFAHCTKETTPSDISDSI